MSDSTARDPSDTPKRGGRPKVYKEPRLQTILRLPASERRALDKLATKRGQSVQECARRILVDELVSEKLLKKPDWD